MELSADVLILQLYMYLLGENSCLANLAKVKVFDSYNIYTFQLAFYRNHDVF